jgi:hypothetical protein
MYIYSPHIYCLPLYTHTHTRDGRCVYCTAHHPPPQSKFLSSNQQRNYESSSSSTDGECFFFFFLVLPPFLLFCFFLFSSSWWSYTLLVLVVFLWSQDSSHLYSPALLVLFFSLIESKFLIKIGKKERKKTKKRERESSGRVYTVICFPRLIAREWGRRDHVGNLDLGERKRREEKICGV